MNKFQIRQLIQNNSPTIFEIGCAAGTDTLEFINTFNDLHFRMFCFEPEPKNVRILRNIIKDQRVKFFDCAISDKDSDSEIFYWSNTSDMNDISQSSSLRKPKEHLKTWPHINFDMQLKIKTKKLDTLVKEESIDVIDFIWADVQGTEDMMIEGGKETFANKVRYLYTEYSNVEYYEGEKSLPYIMNLLSNYEVIQDFGTDVLLRNKNL